MEENDSGDNLEDLDKDDNEPHIHRRSVSFNIDGETEQLPQVLPRRKAQVALPLPWKKNQINIQMLRDYRFSHTEEFEKREYEFSNRDGRVTPVITGLLALHILELHKIYMGSKVILSGVPLSVYCIIFIGLSRRVTKVVSTDNLGRIRLDSAVHIPIQISEWRENPNNKLKIEVWGFQDPEAHWYIGMMKIHIYDIIKNVHDIETHLLRSEETTAGKISFEYAFAYGTFGYGHSNQLRNPDNPIFQTVSNSIFPRIRLNRGDMAPNRFQIREPYKLRLMSTNSFIMEMPDKPVKTRKGRVLPPSLLMEPKRLVIQQVDYDDGVPIHCKLYMNIWQKDLQADINDSYGEFVCYGSRIERLDYLSKLSNGRLTDFRETETGALQRQLQEKDVETVIEADRDPSHLIFPTTFPCTDNKPATYGEGDEEFMNKFPNLQRGPGYLAKLFGFTKLEPEDSSCHNDKDYPAYLDAGRHCRRPMSYELRTVTFCLEDICWHILAVFQTIFRFVFPDVSYKGDIPEIALTTPTPAGSTANIYGYFANEDEDIEERRTDLLLLQTKMIKNMSNGIHYYEPKKDTEGAGLIETYRKDEMFEGKRNKVNWC